MIRQKKSTKINFLGPETAGWGGGLPRESVVVEKFVPSLESLSSKGEIWDVLGISPGCPGPLGVFKKFVQKSSCAFFVRSLNDLARDRVQDSVYISDTYCLCT